MSIFKSQGIILHIKKVGEKNFLYTVFSKEYGKIFCNKKLSKSEKTLDIGYEIQFEISTQENSKIHKIRNIKIIGQLQQKDQTFDVFEKYMTCIHLVNKYSAFGESYEELFYCIQNINSIQKEKIDSYTLLQLKILALLGELPEQHRNTTTQKILKFVLHYKAQDILKLHGIQEEQKIQLKQIVEPYI